MRGIDWSKLQSFALVAEHGSLSAAARAAHTSQPTLSRHITQLEEELGVRLFDRTSSGLALTANGAEIYANARTMNDAANQASLVASGASQEITGTVRITASETIATHILPEAIGELRLAEPSIQIEIVASNQTENLLKREADIAVRMYRPTQTDVLTRKVGEVEIGCFASKDYLARRGHPTSVADALKHDIIGFDKADGMIQSFREAGLQVDREYFPVRTESILVQQSLAQAGCGIVFMQEDLGNQCNELEQVFPEAPLPTLEIWLTAHAELKTSARIRRVYDFLATKLEGIYA